MDYRTFSIVQANRLLERLTSHIKGTAHSQTPNRVHDLRVAVRRFTQALIIGKPCFPPRTVKRIRRRMKATMALTAAVRDCDIAVKLVTGGKAQDAAVMSAKLRARRARAQKTLARSLRQYTRQNYVSQWGRILQSEAATAEVKPESIEDVARRKLPRLAEAYFREGHRAASQKASAGQLHQFRLAAKKFRYTLELLAEFYGPSASTWVEQLRKAQNLLGSISDCSMTRRLVEDMGASRKMVAALKTRQKRKTSEFRKAWQEELGSGEEFRQWLHALHHPQRKPMARAAVQGHHAIKRPA